MKRFLPFLLLALLFSCRSSSPSTPYVVIALENRPTSLDPRIGTDQVSQRLHQILYRGLVRREKDFTLVPDVASRFYRRGQLEWVFEIKEGLKFSDGRPLTARDVLYTYQSIISGKIKTLRRAGFESVEEVRLEGQRKVVFRMKYPYASFLINLTIGIVPEGAGQDFASHPVSSGPYMVAEMAPDHLLLLPNPYYEGRVENKGVLVRIIPDQITRCLELKKGAVDLVVNGFSPDVVYVLKREKGIKVKRAEGGNFAYLELNLRDPALADLRVRRAIGYAIDREAIIKSLLRGYARPACSLLPPMHWAHEEEVFKFSYDPEKARKLLAEAGYSSGLELELKCSSTAFARSLAEVLHDQLGRVGIRLRINCMEFSAFYQQIIRGNFQLYFLMWVGISDPDIFYYTLHSASIPPHGANRGFFVNPLADFLIEKGRQTFDREMRRAVYSQLQKVVSQQVPFIPLWYPDSIAVYREGIEGVQVYPCGDLLFLPEVRKVLKK